MAAPPSSPPPSASPSSAGRSSAPKPRLILRVSSPKKLTIKINPKAAAVTKLWKCGVLTCKFTDMTSKPRVETGRKYVSDYFGRNKIETVAIPDDVWAYVCRKDYQRSKYASDKSADAYRTFWLSALKTQLIRLRLWRPEATFDVKLLNRAEDRLKNYNAELVKNGNNTAAAQQAVFVGPSTGKKGAIPASNADAIDPIRAQYIKNNFSGIRTIDYILNTVLPWIERSLNSGALTRMPPIEFLVQAAVAGDTVNEPSDNFNMWRDFLRPKWSRTDHKVALALMALNDQPVHPMNLTWEAHTAAVAADAAKRAAAASGGPAHTVAGSSAPVSTAASSSASVSSASVSTAVASTSPAHTAESNGQADKGKGKRRMIEEDEQPEISHLIYNGRNTASKKRKIEPTAAPLEKRRTRSSMR